METIIKVIDGVEGFFLAKSDLSKFLAEIYTETEWFPDYVAKGESSESRQSRQDFIRGWIAHEIFLTTAPETTPHPPQTGK